MFYIIYIGPIQYIFDLYYVGYCYKYRLYLHLLVQLVALGGKIIIWD